MGMPPTLSQTAPAGTHLTDEQVRDLVAQACPAKDYKGKKVLLIVPDATRTCPLGLLFTAVFEQIGAATAAFDVMIALGTHQPMSEEAICERLEITLGGARGEIRAGALLQSRVGQPGGAAARSANLRAAETRALTGGLFAMEVPVEINAQGLRLRSAHHHRAGLSA